MLMSVVLDTSASWLALAAQAAVFEQLRGGWDAPKVRGAEAFAAGIIIIVDAMLAALLLRGVWGRKHGN